MYVRVYLWMLVVGRMMGQTPAPPGGAVGTGRMLARLGETIDLLSNPEQLQARIEAFRARQNFTDGNTQVNPKVLNVYNRPIPCFFCKPTFLNKNSIYEFEYSY